MSYIRSPPEKKLETISKIKPKSDTESQTVNRPEHLSTAVPVYWQASRQTEHIALLCFLLLAWPVDNPIECHTFTWSASFFKFFLLHFNLIFLTIISFLKTRQFHNYFDLDLLFKPLIKHLKILKLYLDSFVDCNRTLKLLTLAPSPWDFGWLPSWLGPSRVLPMHLFTFPQHFDPIHVPLHSFLKFHFAMGFLLSLCFKLDLKLLQLV